MAKKSHNSGNWYESQNKPKKNIYIFFQHEILEKARNLSQTCARIQIVQTIVAPLVTCCSQLSHRRHGCEHTGGSSIRDKHAMKNERRVELGLHTEGRTGFKAILQGQHHGRVQNGKDTHSDKEQDWAPHLHTLFMFSPPVKTADCIDFLFIFGFQWDPHSTRSRCCSWLQIAATHTTTSMEGFKGNTYRPEWVHCVHSAIMVILDVYLTTWLLCGHGCQHQHIDAAHFVSL